MEYLRYQKFQVKLLVSLFVLVWTTSAQCTQSQPTTQNVFIDTETTIQLSDYFDCFSSLTAVFPASGGAVQDATQIIFMYNSTTQVGTQNIILKYTDGTGSNTNNYTMIVNVKYDCNKVLFTMNTTTMNAQIFSTYATVVYVNSNVTTELCGNLTINVIKNSQEINGSLNIVSAKNIGSNYSQYFIRIYDETYPIQNMTDLQIQVKYPSMTNYYTLTQNLTLIVKQCEVRYTTMNCTTSQPSYMLGLGDSFTLPYNLNWNVVVCPYTYNGVVTLSQNLELPSWMSQQSRSIQLIPNEMSQVGNYTLQIGANVPYAITQPRINKCTVQVQVLECYITRLEYTQVDQISLNSLTIELFQQTTFQFTNYVQFNSRDEICSTAITYSFNQTFVTIDSSQKITFNPQLLSNLGQNYVEVSYNVPGYYNQPPTSPATKQVLNFAVSECSILRLSYSQTVQMVAYGGSTQSFSFSQYTQEHVNGGNNCNYPIQYSATFKKVGDITWSPLPSWIIFQSSTQLITVSPSYQGQYGVYQLQITAQIQNVSLQPPQNPSENQIITLSVQCSQSVLQNLVYLGSNTSQTLNQTLTSQISGLQFSQFGNSQNADCGLPFDYQIQVFQNSRPIITPSFIQFNSTSLQVSSNATTQIQVGLYKVVLVPSYFHNLYTVSSFPEVFFNIQVQLCTTVLIGKNVKFIDKDSNPASYQLQLPAQTNCGYQLNQTITTQALGVSFDSQTLVLQIKNQGSGSYPIYVTTSTVGLTPEVVLQETIIVTVIAIPQNTETEYFPPGAYFVEPFKSIALFDFSQKIYTIPEIACLQMDPCYFQIMTDMPSYMTLSQNFTQLRIAPINVTDGVLKTLNITFKLVTIYNGSIVLTKYGNLQIQIKPNEQFDVTATKTQTNQNFTFNFTEARNSQKHSFTKVQTSNQLPLIPVLSQISNYGDLTISFNQDVTTFNLNTSNYDQYFQVKPVRGDIYYSADQNYLAFNIQTVSFKPNRLDLKIVFDYPYNVSIGQKPDQIVFSFKNSKFQTKDGILINETFPPQIVDSPRQIPEIIQKVLQSAGNTLQGSLTSIFALNMVISIFMTISLKSMWQLMNLCQIIIFMSILFKMPAAATILTQFIENVAYLRFIPTEFLRSLANPTGSPTIQQFLDDRILLVAVIITATIQVVLILNVFGYFIKKPIYQKVVVFLNKKFFFNFILRYLVTAYLKLYIAAVYSLRLTKDRDKGQNTLFYFYFIFLTAFPLLIGGLLQYNLENLDSQVYLSRMESIYLGIKRNRVAILYTTIFCVRRMMLAFLLLVNVQSGLDKPLFYLYQLLYIGYLAQVEPNQSTFQNRLELIGETLILALIYTQYFFGLGVKVAAQQLGDCLFCVLVGVAILSYIILLVRSLIMTLRLKILTAKRNQEIQKIQKRQKHANLRKQLVLQINKKQLENSNYKQNEKDFEPLDLKNIKNVQPEVSVQNNIFYTRNNELLMENCMFGQNSPNQANLKTAQLENVDLEIQNYSYSREVSFMGKIGPTNHKEQEFDFSFQAEDQDKQIKVLSPLRDFVQEQIDTCLLGNGHEFIRSDFGSEREDSLVYQDFHKQDSGNQIDVTVKFEFEQQLEEMTIQSDEISDRMESPVERNAGINISALESDLQSVTNQESNLKVSNKSSALAAKILALQKKHLDKFALL